MQLLSMSIKQRFFSYWIGRLLFPNNNYVFFRKGEKTLASASIDAYGLSNNYFLRPKKDVEDLSKFGWIYTLNHVDTSKF
jgi:hypothetical protein